jgi:hypothetical protein
MQMDCVEYRTTAESLCRAFTQYVRIVGAAERLHFEQLEHILLKNLLGFGGRQPAGEGGSREDCKNFSQSVRGDHGNPATAKNLFD